MNLFLQQLRLIHFKSYETADFRFTERIVAISGKNGSGKTNLLDAIHHLSLGRSAFHKQDALQIRHDKPFYRLDAHLQKEALQHRIQLTYSPEEKKKLVWDGARPEKMADHVGRLPLVLILPDEPFLMHESSEWRRSFFDNTLSQAFPAYLHHLGEYKRLLLRRNATLKYFADRQRVDLQLLEALDVQMAAHAQAIYQSRTENLPIIQNAVNLAYAWLSSEAEEAKLAYQSELDTLDFPAIIKKNLKADLEGQRTHGGVHKDDYWFGLDGHSLKKTGSQGQQKTFLLALKIAQYRFLQQHKQLNPWLLMDDIFDKLDDSRIQKLLELIQGSEVGQVFITDARPERTEGLLSASVASFQSVRL